MSSIAKSILGKNLIFMGREFNFGKTSGSGTIRSDVYRRITKIGGRRTTDERFVSKSKNFCWKTGPHSNTHKQRI
jgi:hypothetical protein